MSDRYGNRGGDPYGDQIDPNSDPRYQRGGGGGMRLPMRLAPLVIGAVMIAGMLIKGCQEGPFGRRQVVAINPVQESQLGEQAFAEVRQSERGNIIGNGPLKQAVQRIANNLIRASQSPAFEEKTRVKSLDFKWDLEVVQSDQVNAFCLPGGKIVVYTGILPVSRTEGGLAVVMGHEIAHALAHHGAERMMQQNIVNIGLQSASGSMGDMDPGTRTRMLQALNAGAKFGILKYSRTHESEADRLGLYLMAIAGYDPAEAPAFGADGGSRRRQIATRVHVDSPKPRNPHQGSHLWQEEVKPLYQASTQADGGGRALPNPSR